MENANTDSNASPPGGTGATPHLSSPGEGILSSGCAIGRKSPAMPGRTFLPGAVPMGTITGMLPGAGVLFAIGASTPHSHLPVHAVTAGVELGETHVHDGFTDILLKPVTPDTLRTVSVRHIGGITFPDLARNLP